MLATGAAPPAGRQDAPGRTGKVAAARSASSTKAAAWTRPERRPSPSASPYPAQRADWKNTRHVIQTAGTPPNQGRMALPRSGWTVNRSQAATRTAAANGQGGAPRGRASIPAAGCWRRPVLRAMALWLAGGRDLSDPVEDKEATAARQTRRSPGRRRGFPSRVRPRPLSGRASSGGGPPCVRPGAGTRSCRSRRPARRRRCRPRRARGVRAGRRSRASRGLARSAGSGSA
jgi:hypothetical protein